MSTIIKTPLEPVTYPATPAGILAALRALGDTADTVALNLLQQGFRGERGNTARCPIANYLLAVAPDISDVVVDSKEVAFWFDNDTDDVCMPDAPSAFVALFDSGCYYDELDVHVPLVDEAPDD